LAALISFGAAAVCPYLAFELCEGDEQKQANLRAAFEGGLLKIMSKMGISSVRGYQSSRLFTAYGLSQSLLDGWFPGLSSAIGGYDLEDIAEMILRETESARKDLVSLHTLREHNKGAVGERHSMTSALAKLIHQEEYDQYDELTRASHPINPRHLLAFKKPEQEVPLEDVQPAEEILRRFGSGAMSFGAISAESQRDLIRAMQMIGGRSASGEGGENPYYFVDGTTATSKQVASARFGVTAEYLITAQEIEIKVAQGAKPGEGGQLMAVKVDEHIARARHAKPGVDLISPAPLHDIYSIEDLRELIYELKQLKDVRVSVKLVSGVGIGAIAAGVVKAGADVIQISGGDGGTGAASLSSMKHAGLPWELGLIEVHRTLVEQRLREHVVLRVDGGLSTGSDVVMAAMLGAEEFGFGKILLVAEGCIMARVCEKNTCPRGIATHDPKYKAKYRGTPEDVVAFLRHLAEDVRGILSRIGADRLETIVGRADLLEPDPRHEALIASRKLVLSGLLESHPHDRATRGSLLHEGVSRLNARITEDVRMAVDRGERLMAAYQIKSTDRALLATASGALAERTHRLRMQGAPQLLLPPSTIQLEMIGSAGQGFGVFLVEGFDVTLRGEANDSVGKSMSGGRLVIVPHPAATFVPEESSIIGNCALYGATGGKLFVYGRAGDRFAVRNSGAIAVVEGTGLHACEYMTNGTVVILGLASHNIGAGMTGGELFLRRESVPYLNTEYLITTAIEDEDLDRLVSLLAEYRDLTGSRSAPCDREALRALLVRCVPKTIATAELRSDRVAS
jgi:glutamate synthase domain-containing protein 2/glutamate synthase domain-containing protein 3